MKNPKYWHCIIGPVEDSDLPWGADAPPRFATEAALEKMGLDFKNCSSGWIEQSEKDAIEKAAFDNYCKVNGIDKNGRKLK